MNDTFTREDNDIFNTLYMIDVKDVAEKKNGLTYLSWAWAWAEVSKRFPHVDYEVERNEKTGMNYFYDVYTGYMVFTSVTINGVTRKMWLPVMDSSNKAMRHERYSYQVKEYKNRQWTGEYEERFVEPATTFDINKAIMRCLVKNLAMFGLGLYIFAGEDMPEDVSMLEKASDRSKKVFITLLQKIANEHDREIDEVVLMLTEAAKVTADDSKWSKGDLGLLKRGVGWLKQQLDDQEKAKEQTEK